MIAARRIDAIRLTLERYETQLREEEMQKLAAEAELKALRAQINPHFLFNALTTIGYLIESAPPRAVHTLMRLTHLLRGVLRPDGEFTTLGREIELVEHYLDIERERFEERLRVRSTCRRRCALCPSRRSSCSRWSRTPSSTAWRPAPAAATSRWWRGARAGPTGRACG